MIGPSSAAALTALAALAAVCPDPASAPEKDTAWLFDDRAAPRAVEIEMSETDWAWLQDHATLEQYVPALVRVPGEGGPEVFYNAGVRFKGGYGSLYACFDADGNQTCPKLSLKVSFNEYVPGGRMFGVRKLVLNSCTRDSTYLHERLSYHLFRAVGLVASRAVHVSVRVNGGPPSLYLLVENIDQEYLEDHFDDPSGNLLKEVWPQHLVPEPYLEALRTNQDVPDVDRMVNLAELLLGVADADFDVALAPWIDLEAMARYLVVDQLTHNWDGIWKFYCSGEYCQNHNYFLYDDPTSGQVQVLPWDLDHTFNYPNTDMQRSWWDDGPDACVIQQANAFVGTRAPQCDPLMRGLGVLGWDRYLAALAELTAPGAALSPEAQLALLDGWRAQILPVVGADPLGPTLDQWRRDVAQLRQIVRAQHAEALALLAEEGR